MTVRVRPRRGILLTASAALALAAGAARAVVLPQGPVVAGASGGGGATFNYGVAGLLTVNQSASRVVIDWRSFSIGAGGTVNFSQASPDWIAFNRVDLDPATGLSPLSTISGTLNARGGVWLFSTGGILFGPGAVVDVGAFAGLTAPLGAAGGLSQLLNPGSGGLTSVSLDPPIASGVESITVQNGARITANSGFVVLQSETMTQNGAISAFDGVDYTISESGQIVFSTTAGGQQLQSADATIVPGVDRPSFSHGGVTRAAWVGVDAPGGALKPGYHGVINLGGQIEASGVKPGSGGDGVVLLVGDDLGPAFPGYTGSSIGLDASGATIQAAGGLSITTDSVRLGATTLGGALDVQTYGGVTLAGAVSAGGAVLLDSAAGAVNLDGPLTATQSITAVAQSITVGPGATVRADALGQGAGGVVLSSAGTITAAADSLLLAGADAAAPTGNVTVRAGSGAAGGDIVLGRVSGKDVFVQSLSQGHASEGSVTLAGAVEGPQGVTVLINDVAAQGAPAGDLRIESAISSAGFVDLENLGPGAVLFDSGAKVTSSGSQVFLYAGGDTTLAAGAQITGVSLFDHTLGTLTVDAGASLATTGSSAVPIAPVIPFGSDFSRSSGLNLAASAMTIQGAVTAGTPTAPDDVYIEVLGLPGATAVIGGAGGGAGFDLSNASFSHLSGRDIVVMGGPGESSGPGANLQIEDLTLNSTKLAALWLGTASSQSITVSGAVTPTGGGPVDLHLGFVRQGPGGLDGFIPGEIDIVGSLGGASTPLGVVTLIARNDILMGVPAFATAARTDPGFDAVTASSSFPGFAPGHVFVAANSLQIAAQGRVIAQNSPGAGFLFAGLDIGAPTAALPLIFAPAALQGQSIGGGAWTADYGLGPQGVDLFGALAIRGGPTIDDVSAASQPDLLDPAIAARGAYRFNGCVFGAACVSLTPVTTFQPPAIIDTTADPASGAAQSGSAGDLAGASASAGVVSNLTATALTLQQDDERLGSANPITETGNGDLWSGAAADCPPHSEPGKDCPPP